MALMNAVHWFVTQPIASLLNPLSRSYLQELLEDAVNAETELRQRVPLRIASSLEVAAIETVTTDYTDILARLSINWLNPLERYYLDGIVDGLGLQLPYTVDFSTLPDGALPAAFTAPNWAVASGKAVNTPTLGSELLTDPGLEANYTAGKCDTLTLNGSPTLAQSADAHGGTKAQQFTATAFNNRLNYPTVAGIAGAWRQFSMWGKITAGASGNARFRLFETNGLPANTVEAAISGASYTQKKLSMLCADTNAMFCYPTVEVGSSSFATVITDDGSLKAITFSSLFALLEPTQANVIVKMVLDTPMQDDTQIGLVARADAGSNPTHFVMALAVRHPTITTSATVYLLKKVGSTYTVVQGATGITLAAGAWLELRMSGSTVQVYYNNAQVGTNQTVSDAEIVNNTFHGLFSAGDNPLRNFSLASN